MYVVLHFNPIPDFPFQLFPIRGIKELPLFVLSMQIIPCPPRQSRRPVLLVILEHLLCVVLPVYLLDVVVLKFERWTYFWVQVHGYR
jgi:hypothetical protein